VLSDDEIRLVWRAAGRLGAPYGGFVQLLAITGQRRDEVACMRRGEIKGALWTIAADRMKGGAAHDVPLSEPAVRILADAPEIGLAGYAFTVTGEGPISGYSDAKRKLDAVMLALAREADPDAPGIPHWTFHDLRRTAASGMARLGVLVHVIEAVLAHRGGQVSGVAAVYNRHAYLPEKRRALEAWAGHLMQLVGESPATNVVPLRA
jgi:integrase